MKQQTEHPSKIKLLEAAIQVFRTLGYTATRVEDVCAAAGVTKGSFFHHFKGKEELAIEATKYWSEITNGLFNHAPYQSIADPRERVLAYIDFRADIIQGNIPDFTCLLGTIVQETYESYPDIRNACKVGIDGHSQDVAKDIAQAKAVYAPDASWDALSLAMYIQATIQGAFVLAKANNSSEVAVQCIRHLRNYVAHLLSSEMV